LAQVSEYPTLKHRAVLFFGLNLHILLILFLARLIVDSGWRMVYPFIPQFSTGLGLTVVGFSWLIFLRSIAGMTGSLFGILADRYGRRRLMTMGLLAQAAGMMALVLSWQWWAVGPMLLFGIGASTFIPVQQAYVSDKVDYNKRGRALATIDMSYAVSGLFGMIIVGWLIETIGWRSPFLILGVLCLLAAPVIWFQLPAVEDRMHTSLSLVTLRTVLAKSNVLASMGVGLLVFLAAACFVTVWGIWLNDDFNLGAVALGVVATLIGLAELSGVSLSSLFIDRIGKRRGSQIGLILTSAGFLLLPFTQGRFLLAIAMLVFLGAVVEFTIVSLFPLYSEQAPEARATLFSLVGLGISIGLAVGAPITATLWQQVGLGAVCAVAIVCLLVAMFLVWRFLPEHSA
jgi:predicted MFS family arabinose efflux permease